MNIFRLRLIFIIVVLLMVAFPLHEAFANSPHPPTYVWFYFDIDQKTWQDIQGIQLIGCTTENCEQTVLLQQYGGCTDEKCLKTSGLFDDERSYLICADYHCFSRVYPNHGGTNFKLLIQFQKKALLSPIVSNLPSSMGEEKSWTIGFKGDSLEVSADETITRTYPQLPLAFSKSYVYWVSIGVEVIVAILYFLLFLKTKKTIFKLGGIVFLINLLTLTVVWFFFPSFGYFHTAGLIKTGIFTFVLAGLYALLLFFIYRPSSTRRRGLIIFGAISIPFAILVWLVFAFITNYGEQPLIAQGLPAYILIIMEEVFAIAIEAFLMNQYSNQEISKKHAWILALVMNTASFLIGQGIQLFVR